MRVGLVGEAPNDTSAIGDLISKRFSDFTFFPMLNRINGSSLDSQKIKRFLRIEFEDKNPDVIIFIRDLDSILPNKEKLLERKKYFSESNSVVDNKGIFLLNIYEIEALILADINTFNNLFGTNINLNTDVMTIKEPKEFLKAFTNKYNESKNVEIFNQLEFNIVYDNCQYFNQFIKKFENLIKSSRV